VSRRPDLPLSESSRDDVVGWLLDGDPAIRWQTLDHLGVPAADVERERSRVADEGWGRRLLDAQDLDGRWASALYSPKWTSTTYTLLLLQLLGLRPGNPQALAGCRQLWAGARFQGGGLTLATTVREPETCITGMLVRLASFFGYQDEQLDSTVTWLLEQQLDDGGWNCAAVRSGSRHGSFHTTILVLEALLECRRSGIGGELTGAISAGQDFFLRHRLYRSRRTGEVVDTAFTRFPFPPQWHFDVLRGLEHFREAGAGRDPRLSDAVGVVRARRRPDGRWPRHRPYPGRQWFPLEEAGPSRWATLRCLRVLDWWDAGPLGSGPVALPASRSAP
jgi:hypothetical protein